MLLFGWKNRWNRVADQTYTLVADKEHKVVKDVRTHQDALCGIDNELKRLQVRERFWIGVWAMTAAGLIILFFTRSPATQKPLLKTPVPSLPLNLVTFVRDPIYATRPSPESDKAWNALLPPGRGFVYINDGKQYDLEPGQKTPWGEIWSVALFHQVHCLGMIRKQYWMLLDGLTTNDTVLLAKSQEMATKLLEADHIHHCFDYIRQSLMCAGDMAMEWPRTEPDGRRIAVDGWGVPHECKSWDTISDFMGTNHFDHSTNSEIAPN